MGKADRSSLQMVGIRKRIRELREKSGKTGAEIARAIHMSHTVYVKRETGESEFKIAEIVSLSDYYNEPGNNKTGHPIDCHWILTGQIREDIPANRATGLSSEAISALQTYDIKERALLNELLSSNRAEGFFNFWAAAVSASMEKVAPDPAQSEMQAKAVPILIHSGRPGYYTVAGSVASRFYMEMAVDTLKGIMKDITSEITEREADHGND